jgi:hypothetical protein
LFLKYTYYVFQKDAESSRIRPNRQFCREDNWANLEFRFFGKFPIPFWLDENLSERAPPPIWTDEYWKRNLVYSVKPFVQFFFCFLTFPSSRFLIYRKIRQNHLILWLNCLFFIIDGMRYNNDVAKIPRGVCLFSGSGTFIIIGSFNPSYLSLC